ncbi:hypothetical protein [Salinigranum salinum]|uniref:hypothetical protein n=1 Tax=Salinigranum salinum TaxID=1364937 RepID=UPI00126073B1|nr:hypothetical protein [Salinigranum salinum]
MPPELGWMDRFRQPEYTGENRCTPCTVLNVVIAAAVSGLLAVVAPPLGVVAFAAALAVIYLRGYLVPYTPTITKRYFPDRVLRWFDKESGTLQNTTDPDEVEEIDVERTLYSLGVVTECEHVDDLCLDAEFQRAWRDEVENLRDKETKTEDIHDLLDLDPGDDHEIEERGGQSAIVMIDGRMVGQWESHAALTADLAADRVLREWTDEWERFHVINRSELLNSLRMFLEECTECGEPISVGQETVDSCCRSFDVVAVACDGCGSRFFEIELTEEMRQQL